MGTLSSSPCQLRLGGWLSRLGLSHYNTNYWRPAKSLLSSTFFCWLVWHFHYSSFMPFSIIFGHMAPLPTHIVCPISSSSSVYIHCIWVSPWTHLSSFSIERISFSSSSVPSSCSLCYLSPSSPIWSSFSWLCIFPWVHHIPPQYSLLCPALPLVSI